jgi:hypothetical protein
MIQIPETENIHNTHSERAFGQKANSTGYPNRFTDGLSNRYSILPFKRDRHSRNTQNPEPIVNQSALHRVRMLLRVSLSESPPLPGTAQS